MWDVGACTHGFSGISLIAGGQAPAAASAAETSPPSRSRNRPRHGCTIISTAPACFQVLSYSDIKFLQFVVL